MKAAWGTKRTCQSCGARFYDLHRDPIVCPKCATVYDAESILKTRRGRSAEKAVAKPVPDEVEVEEAEVEADLGEDDLAKPDGEEEDEELIEDASELGEDDDDMAEVIEKVDGGEEG